MSKWGGKIVSLQSRDGKLRMAEWPGRAESKVSFERKRQTVTGEIGANRYI